MKTDVGLLDQYTIKKKKKSDLKFEIVKSVICVNFQF